MAEQQQQLPPLIYTIDLNQNDNFDEGQIQKGEGQGLKSFLSKTNLFTNHPIYHKITPEKEPDQVAEERVQKRPYLVFACPCHAIRAKFQCAFFAIFIAMFVILLTFHYTGVTGKSYSVYFDGNEPTKRLECYCDHGTQSEKWRGPQIHNCSVGEVCATSMNREGHVTRGCLPNSHKICEYVYMNDYGAVKPSFTDYHHIHRVKRAAHVRSTGGRSKLDGEYHHFCYCRDNLCNKGNKCHCVRN